LPNESAVIICPNPKCHSKIDEPVLLNNWATATEEQYYACPHCFIKLDVDAENAEPQKEEEKEKEIEKPPVRPPEKGGKGPSACSRHFGYLANRPKDASIPQECLICPKIVNCMLKPSGA
jgi:uncharacterized protein YbaR (Trm112 family)